MQWHPLTAHVLRAFLESYYELQTNVSVGDIPRQADFVLLRRKGLTRPPLGGIWRHLTPWNVLEFKAPTVSARLNDVSWLVEVGLGIYRRLCAKRAKKGTVRRLKPTEVSFWYLANHLGKRFLQEMLPRTPQLEKLEAGVWRCEVLAHPVFLVSRSELPVSAEHAPLHLVSYSSEETERRLAELILHEPGLSKAYSTWLLALHHKAWKEARTMGKTRDKVDINWEGIIEYVGPDKILNEIIEAVGVEGFLEAVDLEQLVEQVGAEKLMEKVLPKLTPRQKRALQQRLS